MTFVKFLVLLFICLNTMGSNQCAHNCYVFGLGENSAPIIAGPKSFQHLAGDAEKLREVCQAKLSLNGEILIFSINDLQGLELIISIRRGSKLLVSSNFYGEYGSVSLYSKGVKLSCSKE